MASKSITLSLREDIEKKLRTMAMAKYGKRKGFISKFLTDAVEDLSSKQIMSEADLKFLELLRTGIRGGGLKKYKREELYER